MGIRSFRLTHCLLALLISWLWFVSGTNAPLQAQRMIPAKRIVEPLGQSASFSSLNWSGYIASGARGTFKVASFEFIVPAISGQPGDHVAIWVGVGGGLVSSPTLVQAGIDAWIGTGGQQVNTPFWEVVPGFTEQQFPLRAVIRAGDLISVSVTSSGRDNFTLRDLTTGSAASFISKSALTDGASAECIVERPFGAGSFVPLARFNTLSITNCQIGNSARITPMGNVSNRALNMINAGGATLTTAGPLSQGSNFVVSWDSRL